MDDKYLIYNEMLSTEWNFGLGVIIFLSCLAIGVAIFCCKMKQPYLALTTVILFGILLGVGYRLALHPIKKDIEQKCYVVYKGEFYVEEYYSATRSGTYILIKTKDNTKAVRYKVVCDVADIANNSNYSGYFVYSENSKYLVDIFVG